MPIKTKKKESQNLISTPLCKLVANFNNPNKGLNSELLSNSQDQKTIPLKKDTRLDRQEESIKKIAKEEKNNDISIIEENKQLNYFELNCNVKK